MTFVKWVKGGNKFSFQILKETNFKKFGFQARPALKENYENLDEDYKNNIEQF